MQDEESLIPKHGGYRNLKTFRIARLVYDVTVRFCNRYIDRRSRTHDQMVQAARSGVQNIAEGSQFSGTSKKMEMKLTNVARGSLEELKLNYEDFLRHRGLEMWEPSEPALVRFKRMRCSTLEEFRVWVEEERGRPQTSTKSGAKLESEATVPVSGSPCRQPSRSELAANGALSLLNLCCHLLDRQLAAQARAFEEDGGFTERLYQHRKKFRGR